ncbi:hypothetical protein GCM10010221_05850 [Streptomyces parvus]|nr:hypothetical protein GCM10010221_05850 [Streptomyces parvus]
MFTSAVKATAPFPATVGLGALYATRNHPHPRRLRRPVPPRKAGPRPGRLAAQGRRPRADHGLHGLIVARRKPAPVPETRTNVFTQPDQANSWHSHRRTGKSAGPAWATPLGG